MLLPNLVFDHQFIHNVLPVKYAKNNQVQYTLYLL